MSQLPLPHHSLKFVDSAEFLSLSPYVKASYLVLERKVADLRCRGRVEGALEKDDCWWTRVLGISRRSRRALESHGLIRIDVAALVLVHYDVEAEVKQTAFLARQRRLAHAGADARWGPPEHSEEIPEEIPERSLELNLRNHSFDAMPSGNAVGQCPVEQIFSESGDPLGSGDQEPVEDGPLWARSVSQRVAPASRPTVANRVLRRRKVGPAPAPPGRARLSARAGHVQRYVKTAATGPEAPRQGGRAGPDFELWYELYRRLTGVPYRRPDALRAWDELGMTAAQRCALWEFTKRRARQYRAARQNPPNPARFLRVVWKLEQIERRRQARGKPSAAADVVADVIKRRENLKGGEP